MTTILLFLYGLSAWGAACNGVAWARLFWLRLRGDRGPLFSDVYLGMRAGMLLLSSGIVGLAGDRVLGQLLGEMALTVPSAVGVVSIALMASAEVAFLHVAALNARARAQLPLAWRIYWVGAAAWAGFNILAA